MTTVTGGGTAADRALDEALERMRQLASALAAVRAEHHPALARRRLRARPAARCRCCAQPYPCRTAALVRAAGVGAG